MKIDSSKKPNIPYDDWTIESHDTSLGKIDPTKIELYLDESQKSGYIEGNKLLGKLKDKPVLNATVLDYLFEHQELIPESWKGKYVYFWGTVYHGSSGNLYVRCLYFYDGAWRRDSDWLDIGWFGSAPAALLASPSSSESKSLVLEKRVKELELDMKKLREIIKF